MGVLAEVYSTDEGWFARVPSRPGCMTQASSFEELIAELLEAIEVWDEVAEELDFGLGQEV